MTDPEPLADRVLEGDLRLYELEEHTDHDSAVTARRDVIERTHDADLETIGSYAFPAEAAEANIENMIGAVQVPMGVAGPLPVKGGEATGEYHIPLATTEGALVASVNRGCAVLRRSGGVSVRVTASGMTRAPVFAVPNLEAATETVEWVRTHHSRLAETAEETTRFGSLKGIEPHVLGSRVFLRFRFDTGDAMGMNMVTIATRAACELIEAETPATLLALSGNLCSDKKPAGINATSGRGRTVSAEARIPRDVIEGVLGTTPEAMAEIQRSKNYLGSAKAASFGFNAQAANVIAASFLATGQDEAHPVEGSNTITSMALEDGDLYASVTCASLLVGTIGGGTALPAQQEALELIGLDGGGDPPGSNADALAEVIAGGALAGELSLIGALAERQLSSAHERLGR